MKVKKINLLILILITTIAIVLFSTQAFASETLEIESGSKKYSATINPDDYKPENLDESDVTQFQEFGGRIAGVVQVIGTMVSVGAMIIIGIRYVASSADQKAEYRERMIPYFIGAVLLFGASNVVNIIYKIFAE